MLTIPQIGTLLLDAGEGSYGQLYRHLGPESHSASWFANEYLPFSVDDCLRQLTFIFVSHLHADHHLGIVRILIKWNQVMQRDADARRTSRTSVIHMVAPLRFWTWLQEYAQVEELGLQYVKFYNAHDLLYYAPKQKPAAMLQALNMLDVGTTEVIHCPYAYAISLTSKDGFKFVYSGDTRPCDKLIQLGQSATVLLHEATFEDDMAQEALDKRHSTTGEAIHVAEQSNAKSLLLTHFSQRYPRVPVLPASATSQQRTSIAFDLMTVPLDRMPLLPRYIHSLQVLWQEDVKPEEEERL
jgi:ribonuclease Z